jgi:hypothetical protein
MASILDYFAGTGNTGTTQTSTSVPSWAQGYMKDVLAKGAALTNTKQNPYQTYKANRIAGFTPMQQQSFEQAQGMSAGPEAFSQGISAYMSPYMQNVVDIQKREAGRQSNILGTQQQAQATQAGAFGGGRDAIQRAERERNLSQQMGDIQARGSQAAYDQAAAQFRQGITQGMDINRLQNMYGAQQQEQAQKPLDLAYQNFINQQNYPYKQLGYMSDLLTGMPMGQQTTKSVYEPPPSTTQTLGALGAGAYGLSKMGAFAEGGEVKGYAGDDGSVVRSPMHNKYKMADSVRSLTDEQLQNIIQNPTTQAEFEAAQEELAMRASEARGLASAVTPEMADQMVATGANGGIVAFKAGGSPSAIDYLKQLDPNVYSAPSIEEQGAGIRSEQEMISKLMGPSALDPYSAQIKGQRADLKEKGASRAEGMGWLALSKALVEGPHFGKQLVKGLSDFGEVTTKLEEENRKADLMLQESEIRLESAKQARKDGMVDKAATLYGQSQDLKQKAADSKNKVIEAQARIKEGLENAQLQASTSRYATDTQAKVQRESINKPGEVERKVAEYERRLGRKLTAEEYKEAIGDISAASFGVRHTGQYKGFEHQKMIEDVLSKNSTVKMLQLEAAQRGTTPERREEINRLIEAERQKIAAQFPGGQDSGGAAPSASAGAPVKITSQEQYLKLPSGTTFVAPDGSIRTKP